MDAKPAPSRPTEVSGSGHASGSALRDETIAQPAGNEALPTLGAPAVVGEIGTLGPYRIVKELGRGGMGAVYAAMDTRLNRRLALKVMLPQFAVNASAKERFLREARAAAGIKHDNVVTLYEADVRDGMPYIAMEFLEGYPLDEYLKKRGVPTISQVLRIAAEVASGLAAAHKIGVVHRDIKPGNLWLEAPNGRVKVLDFGLAKPVDAEVELTKSGAVVGTPAYMSPEQARGEKVDPRSDLFSLGSVMYRLCAGRSPFEGATTMAVLMALGIEEPTPVREVNPNVPESLAALIHQLLAKRADARPQDAAVVIKRVRAIAAELTSPRALKAEPVSQPAHPQMAQGAIPVTSAPPDQNPFGELDSTATESTSSEAARSASPATTPKTGAKPIPKSTRKSPAGWPRWVPWALGGGLTFLALTSVGVIILFRSNAGSEKKIETPIVAKVTNKKKDDKTPVQVSPEIKPPATVSDPDRQAADYVFSLGGKVRAVGDARDYLKFAGELPNGRFTFGGFDLQGTKVTDAGLAHFKDCNGLVFVHLGYTAVTDPGLANFKNRKKLWFLDLASTNVTNAGLAHFKDCKELGHLNLNSTTVTDPGLAAFKDSKGVGYLNLGNTAVTDAGLAHFKGCKDVGTLILEDTAVTDVGLANFLGSTGLTNLVLNGTKVTGAGLESFKNCKALGFVNLHSTKLTDTGLGHLKACKDIWLINLSGTEVTDAGVAQLKDCNNLAHLQLDGTAVTDSALAYFKDCKGLGYLGLLGTKVTDTGLASMQECKNLTYLNLRGTTVTANAMAAFHAAVPGCRIEHDGGAIEAKK